MIRKHNNDTSLENPMYQQLTCDGILSDNAFSEALPISEGVRREMLKEKELVRKYHITQR